MTTPEKYAVNKFNEWWSKEMGNRMAKSKYLARKAWLEAWFQRMTITPAGRTK